MVILSRLKEMNLSVEKLFTPDITYSLISYPLLKFLNGRNSSTLSLSELSAPAVLEMTRRQLPTQQAVKKINT